jgi:hypothetical protein
MKLPVREQILHCHCIVALSKLHLHVQAIGLLDMVHVDFDAQSGALWQCQFAIDNF